MTFIVAGGLAKGGPSQGAAARNQASVVTRGRQCRAQRGCTAKLRVALRASQEETLNVPSVDVAPDSAPSINLQVAIALCGAFIAPAALPV
eukprot:5536660-Pyramimonas_sp.AAC.1